MIGVNGPCQQFYGYPYQSVWISNYTGLSYSRTLFGIKASNFIIREILSKGLLLPKGLLWRENRVQDDNHEIIFS